MHPHFLLGGRLEPPTKFSKKEGGGLTRPQLLEGVAGNDNTILGALDHDWKLTGIVASVNLFNEIPEESNESFFTGKATVITLKIESLKNRHPCDTRQKYVTKSEFFQGVAIFT